MKIIPMIPEEKKLTKKIVLMSIGKYLCGIAVFYIVFNILFPSYTLPIKTIARNTATAIVKFTNTYYNQTGSLCFTNTTYVYGDKIIYDKETSFDLPEGYKCTILDSMVIVEHKKGIKAEVAWR